MVLSVKRRGTICLLRSMTSILLRTGLLGDHEQAGEQQLAIVPGEAET